MRNFKSISRNHPLAGILKFVVTGLLLVLLVSCSGRYQWGHPGKLEFTTIHVAPINNASFAPQAHVVLAGQIRDFIIRDGRLRLVNDPLQADAILEVTVVDYRRSGGTRDPQDTTRVVTSDLQLQASVNLLKGDSADAWFRQREVSASTSVYTSNLFATPGDTADLRQDALEAEFQEMPNLTRELARRISDEVLNSW